MKKSRAKEKWQTRERTCPYCGRKFHSANAQYCKLCIAEGMHWLHKVTGRTNGWDRPAGRRAAAG